MIHLVGHNYNTRDIIRNIFSPLVGVLSSPLADEVCHRNNLSFVQMLQPFAKLQTDAQFRDVSDTSVSIRDLRLNFCDVDWRPPQTVLARKMLNEAVTNAQNEKVKFVTIGSSDLELPTAEPWFENWRETFLTVQFPADHEFTRNFLSCLIVLSSGDPNIVDTAHKLTQRIQQMQSVTPQKLPKWFHSNDILNSYVVLHEGYQDDLSKAQQGYELLKSTFGDKKCFLIQINSLEGSVNSELPDYWSPYIKLPTKGSESQSSTDQLSAPKTPQDTVSVMSMPTMQMSTLLEGTMSNDGDAPVLHPLSPVQENATEAINSRFSISSESIASHTINPNVWTGDLDADGPYGIYLNAMDVENLRHFVQDYTVRALMPYVEHLVAVLSEAITNKKGVSKSLLSATKRWFVTSKPGASANNQNAVIYTQESAELQTRKLGDLYFMFGHYNLAFQAYHQAKRDFNADSAWQYYAGALEMAAMSAFMLGTANRKTYDYMEDAIVCYLTVCKLQQFATRATLLSIECLKAARLYGEAAKQLIRMTSEESDLRSALLLEQAAYCFLASQPSMPRKYAFHIVLSGNRYSRSGQRKHAYRCYRQAYQVFQKRGWSLAEDHIQYTMAKQACTLKKLEEASQSYAHLLRPGSLQSAQQQAIFVKEYIQTQNELIKRGPELGLLPHALPHIVQDSIRVLIVAQPSPTNAQYIPASNINIKSNLTEESIWHKIEEMIVATAASNKPFVFKPSQSLFTKENPTTDSPIAVQGEPIEISVTLSNTVKCGIKMSDIQILWQLKLDNDELLSNQCLYENNGDNSNKAAINAAIKTSTEMVTLDEHSEKTLCFKLTPKLTGTLNIIGIVGKVATLADSDVCLLGSLYFETQRIKMAGNRSSQTLLDNKLSIRITPIVPALCVGFSTIPMDLIAGEIIPVTISLRNTGIIPIDDIYVGCDNPRFITILKKDVVVPLSILNTISAEKLVKDREIRRQHIFRLLSEKAGVALKAQEGTTVQIYIQAPYQKGPFTLRLLFYYGLPSTTSAHIKYRLVRHSWKFNIHECMHAEATCVISNVLTSELGLDINVKNNNKPEDLIQAELYINTLGLYSSEHKLNADKLHLLNQNEISAGSYGEYCIKSLKSANLQCRLEARSHIANSPNETSLDEILKSRLSLMDIMPAVNSKDLHIPALNAIQSFLVKHETVFFNTNISTEDFNNAVTRHDNHTTVAFTWMSSINHNSVQRIAFGQHFLQLRYLYETASCPQSTNSQPFKGYSSIETLQKICDVSSKKQLRESHEINTEFDDEFWENNDFIVGKRCLLEDENFAMTMKA